VVCLAGQVRLEETVCVLVLKGIHNWVVMIGGMMVCLRIVQLLVICVIMVALHAILGADPIHVLVHQEVVI
jgi:hypothetical protein